MDRLAAWTQSSLPAALLILFIAGAALLWLPLVSRFRINRMSRLGMLKGKLWNARESPSAKAAGPETEASPRARAYRDRARLAGLDPGWTLQRFQLLKLAVAVMMGLLLLVLREAREGFALTSSLGTSRTLLGGVGFSFMGWWLPELCLYFLASRSKSRYLLEIAKLAERLALCVTENADIRDVLLRAARPLVLLKPPILELATMWGKNQQQAIERFQEAVGITEVFPLVNALHALSRAEAEDVVKVLQEQTKSIEATLESDIARRLENAPIWISFCIMVPFSCVVLLFLYPWVVTVQTQLWSTYSLS
ncbi:hypothetical protein [Gorillibacterium sp. CAU 1737]|uniref:hypothetical protein n=1 Tax=Gorillibacterium sp. CAU 1737 TaxID=3140362 RepID=UPI00326137CE